MTPEAFVSKWSATTTKERAAAQEHFLDLCKLFEEPTPNEADPTGEWYAFEKGVEKTGAGRGWADVWKRGHFGWEYKSKSGGRTSTMEGALQQLQLYALALESPPLLVVSDIDTIEIHTSFQNAVQEVHIIKLEEILRPEKRDILRAVFRDPERLRPRRTRDQVTAEAAGHFAQLAYALRADGHDPHRTAHFLNKLLFCMFAEDVGLLKVGLFTDIVEKGVLHPQHFNTFIQSLFLAMHTGGPFGTEIIDWFNGGLFDSDDSLPMSLDQIRTVRDLAHMNWSQIEPAIFGTLFERGLDPAKRSQLGAHYTDPQSIMRLVIPTIVEPLLEEWLTIKSVIAQHLQRMEAAKSASATRKNRIEAESLLQGFLERLRSFRVLDPACGSGNFLYLSLQAIKDIEHRVNIEAEALGLQRYAPMVGPEVVQGIELSSYAAELARVTVWIGEIQWMITHGYSINSNPILKPLENIEQRDAILNEDGTESVWPQADVIVGNPPFLGDRKMIRELGEEYVTSLRRLYNGRVPGGADLVTYWLEKSRAQIENNKVSRVGLVATNSIRGGANRRVLERILSSGQIFNAWSDEAWINEGAAVRVSLICFSNIESDSTHLNGEPVRFIFSDLSADTLEENSFDVTRIRPLHENINVAFVGVQRNGDFDLEGSEARRMLNCPNPNRRSNADVLIKTLNAKDITSRPADRWLIDFGLNKNVAEIAQYEEPYRHVEQHVRPARIGLRRNWHARYWWLFGDPRPALRNKIYNLDRYIVTPQISKHRVFVFVDSRILIENANIAIARNDFCTFGILQSRFHELWSLRMCSSLEDRPRYTNTTTFETFPFPNGLTPNLEPQDFNNLHIEALCAAAEELCELRDNWLNPAEWVERVPEVVFGYPDRVLPKVGHEVDLKKRTLTNLYNARPTWLVNAHRKLDEAVAASYGWSNNLTDQEILERLLTLNLERAAQFSGLG